MTDPIKPCASCAHYHSNANDFLPIPSCSHPDLKVRKVDYVHGTEADYFPMCALLRRPEGECKPEGLFWEEAPPPPPKPEPSGWLGRWLGL